MPCITSGDRATEAENELSAQQKHWNALRGSTLVYGLSHPIAGTLGARHVLMLYRLGSGDPGAAVPLRDNGMADDLDRRSGE